MSLTLEQITKNVGAETHIYETTLELEPGLTVFIGQTLAGKTSLMRLMAGLDKPTTGRVTMDGLDVTKLPVQKRNVAMVYQQFINYPSLTVYENIASPLKLAGKDRSEIDRQVNEVAEMMHIEPYLQRMPGELSGGQQQRTAMARALVKESELLLFDEPLVNLDYKLREELRSEMRDIFKRRRAIVVYSTTEPMEALLLGGQCVVLDRGRVLQTGAAVQVYHNPATERVGEVFSDPPINTISGSVSGEEILFGDGVVRFPVVGALQKLAPSSYRFGVRANDLSVARCSADDIEIRGTVELAEVSGSETFIHISHNGCHWVVQEEGVHLAGIGQEITVFFHPLHVFAFATDGSLVASADRTLGR